MRAAALALAALLPAAAGAAEVTLQAARPKATALQLRGTSAQEGWRFRVIDAGREIQAFAVTTDAPQALPTMADADGDGAADLWVPSIAGNANTEYEIWRMDPATGRFGAAGSVSGFDFRHDGGYLVAIARNGCCAVGYGFHRMQDGALAQAFSIGTRFREDGRVEACEVTPVTQRPPAELRQRWCAPQADGPRPGRRL